MGFLIVHGPDEWVGRDSRLVEGFVGCRKKKKERLEIVVNGRFHKVEQKQRWEDFHLKSKCWRRKRRPNQQDQKKDDADDWIVDDFEVAEQWKKIGWNQQESNKFESQ